MPGWRWASASWPRRRPERAGSAWPNASTTCRVPCSVSPVVGGWALRLDGATRRRSRRRRRRRMVVAGRRRRDRRGNNSGRPSASASGVGARRCVSRRRLRTLGAIWVVLSAAIVVVGVADRRRTGCGRGRRPPRSAARRRGRRPRRSDRASAGRPLCARRRGPPGPGPTHHRGHHGIVREDIDEEPCGPAGRVLPSARRLAGQLQQPSGPGSCRQREPGRRHRGLRGGDGHLRGGGDRRVVPVVSTRHRRDHRHRAGPPRAVRQ